MDSGTAGGKEMNKKWMEALKPEYQLLFKILEVYDNNISVLVLTPMEEIIPEIRTFLKEAGFKGVEIV
jgi:hypothetical protein